MSWSPARLDGGSSSAGVAGEAVVNVRLDLPTRSWTSSSSASSEQVLQRLEPRPTESEYLSVAEAAELLRCKRQRVYDLMSAGQLERIKEGSRVLVRRSDLVAHLLPQGTRSRIGTGVA